jgi:hypothetical protein
MHVVQAMHAAGVADSSDAANAHLCGPGVVVTLDYPLAEGSLEQLGHRWHAVLAGKGQLGAIRAGLLQGRRLGARCLNVQLLANLTRQV